MTPSDRPPASLTSIFNHPSRWTKGAFARDKDGVEVDLRIREASCWCLAGALRRCGIGDMSGILCASGFPAFQTASIPDWNDQVLSFEEIRVVAEAVDKFMGWEIYPLLD